jgi:hypothetical protein
VEIELPDGTILDAPDGANPKMIVQGYNKRKGESAFQAANKGNVDEMSTVDKLVASTGAGMTDVARHAANLFAHSKDEAPRMNMRTGSTYQNKKTDPSAFGSDESIAEQKRTDEALDSTKAGFVGKMLGQVAATGPIGGGAKLGTGLLAAAAPKLAQAAPRLVAALTGRAAQATLEGAGTGALMADPEDKAQGAGAGSVLSLALNRLGKGAGRLVGGLVKRNQATEDLVHLASQHGEDLHVPLAQAADDKDLVSRLAKSVYKDVLPIVPGVEGRLAGQRSEAVSSVRKMALKEATPDGGSLPAGSEDDLAQAIPKLKKTYDAIYDSTVKALDYPVPKTFAQDVANTVRSKVQNVDDTSVANATKAIDELMGRYSNGGSHIEGSNILNVKNEMSDLIKRSKGQEKQALIAAQTELEDIITKKMGVQNPAGLAEYTAAAEPYSNFVALQKAAKSAKRTKGNFTPGQLAGATRQNTANYELGQAANEALGAQSRSGITGKLLSAGVMGGTAVASLPALAAVVAGGHAMASPTVQKALMGTLRSQQALANALRKHPELARMAGSSARRAAVIKRGED